MLSGPASVLSLLRIYLWRAASVKCPEKEQKEDEGEEKEDEKKEEEERVMPSRRVWQD